MQELTIHIAGNAEDDRLLATAFDVVSSDGTLISNGIASPLHPKKVRLLDGSVKRVYVIGYSPSGHKVQESKELDGVPADIWLNVAQSPHEWLQWVAPFRSLNHLYKLQGVERAERHIGQVWMTLWRYSDGRWAPSPLNPRDHNRDNGMRQVALDVPQRGVTLLQVGGDDVAWRLISLPPGGPVRVALTRSPNADPDTDSVDVTIGRTHPENDVIMSYLAQGAIVEATRLGEAWEAADRLLAAKQGDSVSAAAGAYLLLKIGKLGSRIEWLQNLVDGFPNLPDGPIIAAALELRHQSRTGNTVRKYLRMAVKRGVPVFAMGAALLVETMAAVHKGKRESRRFRAAYQSARAFHQARTSRGAYFSFYGKSPLEPSWLRYKGPPYAPSPDLNDLARSNTGMNSRDIDLGTWDDGWVGQFNLPDDAGSRIRTWSTKSLPSDDGPRIASSDARDIPRPMDGPSPSIPREEQRQISTRGGESLPWNDRPLIGFSFAERSDYFQTKDALSAPLEEASQISERARNAFNIFDGSE